MKFLPAISTSNSVLQHLPPKSRLQIHSLLRFRCKSPHFYSIIISSSSSSSKLRSSSASTTNCCSQQRNQASSCPIENQKKQWIHFIGIGGCGLSALAKLALKQGFEVSGSDVARSLFMDGLQEAGAVIYLGHSVSNIHRNNGSTLPNAVVVSSAIPSDNVEIVHAKSFGVPVYKRDSWLRKVTSNYNLISVSGTHGKSTTAGMLAYVLSAMGDDLTAIVGAHVPQFPGGNILLGCGSNFVLEADEYDGCFLGLSPYIAVITNVEWEHVDIFQDEEAVRNSFRGFLKQIRVGGHLILCGDSDGARFLLSDTKMETASRDGQYVSSSEMLSAPYSVTTYGISNSNEWHASSVLPNLQGGTDYVLHHMGYPVADISLQLAGNHNVLNSLAVIAAITILFSDRRLTSETVNCVRAHLNNFIGISRRFELIGNVHGCHIYDDYAHHPTEIRATLQAARQRFPLKALWVLFQPHTYSRLAALMEDFANAFNDADRVVVTEVYAARETNIWNVSGRDLATSITGPSSEYIPSLGDVVNKLAVEISTEPDREILVFTLGAGDITTVGPMLLSKLQAVKKLPALENFTGVKDAGKGFHTISNDIIPLLANWEVTEIQGM